MKKILIFEKRKKARELRQKNWSIRKIAQAVVASKDSVNKWVKMGEAELLIDGRGWEKGRMRKHSEEKVERIKTIRRELEKEESYFIGDKVVQQNYQARYGSAIPLWFVDKVLKDHNMVKSPAQLKDKGKSRYMQYPEQMLRKTGKSMMSMDFIGPKYLEGASDRINFLSCKYIRPIQVGNVKQVNGQTTAEAIMVLKEIWKSYPIPEVVKMDNDSAFGANLSHKRCLGRLGIMLLNVGVIPLYIAPRSPWNNGHVEGFNSIFAKKFWNKLRFSDEDELAIKIKEFNVQYEKYSSLMGNNIALDKPRYLTGKESITTLFNKDVSGMKAHRVIFLRIVRRKGEKGGEDERGFINILGVEINIAKSFINLFTWCELDVRAQRLTVSVEEETGGLTKIKTLKYRVKNINYKES